MDRLVYKFLDYLENERNYSIYTVDNYNNDLNLFVSFLDESIISATIGTVISANIAIISNSIYIF